MEAKNNIKEQFINVYFKILTFFTIGSFLGCIYETIYILIKKGILASRHGLIYGPFSQVYGFGIVVAVLLLEKLRKKNKKVSVYFLGGILCGVVEYFCSWVQEVLFGTYSWNYQKYMFNINGRTSIIHIFFWGFLIFLFMEYLYPLIMKWISKFNNNQKKWLSIGVSIFFILNILVSSYACIRQNERRENVPATNGVQKFFDKHYPDEMLEKVYPNKRYKK